MTTFYLIRHGSMDQLGHTLCGRMPGVHLNEKGQAEVKQLAERLSDVPLAALYSSPLERTRETAERISQAVNRSVEIRDAILESDFGIWTGRTFSELDKDPAWRAFNAYRTTANVPGGETFVQIQQRMVAFAESLRPQFPNAAVALVSHADPIKTLVAHYAGLHLDTHDRLEISPASYTIIQIEQNGLPRLLTLNNK
jgi:probable phosphomutase (TIGR03848 family)